MKRIGPPAGGPTTNWARLGSNRSSRPPQADSLAAFGPEPQTERDFTLRAGGLEMPGSTLTNPLAELQNQTSNYEPEPCRQRCREEPQNPGVADHDGDFTRYGLLLYPRVEATIWNEESFSRG